MCFCVCDYMLQSIALLDWKPSIQAAGAMYISRKYLGYTEGWVSRISFF